jgi:hypothetical protein
MLSTYSKKLLANSSLLLKSYRYFLTAKFPEIPDFGGGITSYEELHRFSVENSEKFWGVLAQSRLQWSQPFNQVRSGSFSDEYFDLKWFVDGKLNVSGIFTQPTLKPRLQSLKLET